MVGKIRAWNLQAKSLEVQMQLALPAIEYE